MPRRNRVDPFGDLHADEARGALTGNRGCLVDQSGDVVRHHQGRRWIICVTSFRDWNHPVAAPGRWTPVFFLDEAVGLSAGHRPCALCRRPAFLAYREALAVATGAHELLTADQLDRRLSDERLIPGGGLVRAAERRRWPLALADVPDGAVIVDRDQAMLVLPGQLRPFGFGGWGPPHPRPPGCTIVEVLTPPTSLAALRGGYRALTALVTGQPTEWIVAAGSVP